MRGIGDDDSGFDLGSVAFDHSQLELNEAWLAINEVFAITQKRVELLKTLQLYGQCCHCGHPILQERLESNGGVATCIFCQREEERGQRGRDIGKWLRGKVQGLPPKERRELKI